MNPLDDLRQKTDLKLQLPVSYYFKPAKSKTKKTVLLLHGYQDSASALFKRAFTENPQEFEFNIFAPNGVYPVPVKAEQGYREAYAWYFVDGGRKFVLVAPEVATQSLMSLVRQVGIADHEFLIVGFSQGGILAPFVARELSTILGIIGLGTMFFDTDYTDLSNSLPIDSIHGADDDVITLQTSLSGYEALMKAQPRPGSYYRFNNLKHTLDDAARAQLMKLIADRFGIK